MDCVLWGIADPCVRQVRYMLRFSHRLDPDRSFFWWNAMCTVCTAEARRNFGMDHLIELREVQTWNGSTEIVQDDEMKEWWTEQYLGVPPSTVEHDPVRN